jgi:hypothetical protein
MTAVLLRTQEHGIARTALGNAGLLRSQEH